MLTGAKRETGVDLEIDRARIGRVGRRVDEEAAGADRLQPGLAHGHPVGLAELFEDWRAAAETCEHRDVVQRRVTIEVSVDQPVIGFGRVRFIRDQHGRIGRPRISFGVGDGLGLRPGTWQGYPPAHLPADSFANLASRAARPLAA